MSSSLSSSIKQPHRVTRYQPNLQRQASSAAQAAAEGGAAADPGAATGEEPPADWLALLSLILGVIGLMMRYKLCAWLALFCCMGSIANLRKKDVDLKQVFSSLLFAVMSLIMNYFAVRAPPGASEGGIL